MTIEVNHVDAVQHKVQTFKECYPQRRRNFRLDGNADFSRDPIILNAQISGIPGLLRT